MGLNTQELGILQYHATNNPCLLEKSGDYTLIEQWYDQIPIGELKDLICILTTRDRKNYFAFTDFPTWYSNFCGKIEADTTTKIFGMTNVEIDILSINLLTGIIEYGLTEQSMQQLVQHLMRRNIPQLLDCFLKCLGANGDFLEVTLYRLSIDMSPLKRWQSMGLSSAPTVSEIQGILT